MEVTLNHSAEISLRTLGDEDRRIVNVWCDFLKNWETDPFVRSKSRRLAVPGRDNVYILNTPTDIRLFFELNPDGIEVTDIVLRQTLERMARAS